ncbi:DUF4124 domain-containing protein [Comamonas avium]|uniref:DUF4124 domain-containing protein n=1 Tax=Comamonas avium TaxID=2762231 RepID=A0ABR8S869_9BURK|nr:DUF4124 domain-containing protein [Comamonas avium]MBD7959673.1 DUF4124 domain-containing protein [Comamonas avium]
MRLASHIRSFVLCKIALAVLAISQPSYAAGIYTCVDASGLRITADRPIAQCADREQRVLGPTGIERSRVGPAMSEVEMSQRLEQRRNELQMQQRVQEQRRRDAVLLTRYPRRESHDVARRDALIQVQEQKVLAQARMQELVQEKRKLQQELEFYGNDHSKLPARLRIAVQDVEDAQQEQRALMDEQNGQVQRVHKRFDAELLRLQPLWQSQEPASSAASQ